VCLPSLFLFASLHLEMGGVLSEEHAYGLQLKITTIIFFFFETSNLLLNACHELMVHHHPGREQGEKGGDFTASPEEEVLLPWSVSIVASKPLASVMFSCGT
jgi:hypothetical protein